MKLKEELKLEMTRLLVNECINYKKILDNRGCKNKISYKTFIKVFIDKLETNLTWDRLGEIYKISKSHLHATYCKLADYGIFKNSFHKFLKEYNIYIDNSLAYIDTTTILNKYGYIKSTGMNTYENKKHKSNKLSLIVSKNGIPLGIHLNNGNIHDINLLLNTLPTKYSFKYLYCDKSYNSKKLKEKLLITKKIELIYPYKKNQIDLNTINNKEELKKRMKIEHINNRLKQNKIINTRYIKDIENFKNFIYLGCLKIGLQIIINDFYTF
jgi:transposase